MYDIIIIGAGPAGLTAAVYARRSGKTVLVLEKASFGGQMTYSPKIENFPSEISVSGSELADKMLEQALALGAEIELEEVLSVEKSEDGFAVVTDFSRYCAKALIIAAGAEHRRLGVSGEDNLIGRGISFCAVCDGAFYSGKDVMVIGGGNSAAVEALLLADICKSVTVVQNLPFLTAEKASVDALMEKPNVRVMYSSTVKGFKGDESLTGVLVEVNGEEKLFTPDGVFVAVGLAPKNKIFEGLTKLDSQGYITSDESCVTDTRGVFVAGDCRAKSVRQIATAVADGAVAAIEACKFIDSLK